MDFRSTPHRSGPSPSEDLPRVLFFFFFFLFFFFFFSSSSFFLLHFQRSFSSDSSKSQPSTSVVTKRKPPTTRPGQSVKSRQQHQQAIIPTTSELPHPQEKLPHRHKQSNRWAAKSKFVGEPILRTLRIVGLKFKRHLVVRSSENGEDIRIDFVGEYWFVERKNEKKRRGNDCVC